MSSTLELDQDDMTARLQADAVTGLVKVFSQRKGVSDNDVLTRLGALNSKDGLTGLVLIVLMPKLVPQEANTPGAMYFVRFTVQVIDWPAVRATAGGFQMSAEELAERVRQILHFAAFGRGQSLFFDGMDPLPMQDPNQISYGISFRKVGADTPVAKCAVCQITPNGGASPQAGVVITNGTAGSTIYFSTDGSYPSSKGAAAVPPTSTAYTGPVDIPTPALLRAAAEKSGLQPGDPTQAVFT